MTRNLSEFKFTLLSLAGEFEVHPTFLMEDEELTGLIKNGATYEELSNYCEENF